MKLRPLEKRDLPYIYEQENSRKVMALWFEEPYTSFDELQILYDRHILDQTERRFVVEENDRFIGVVELMDIDTLHRHTEIQIIIHSEFQGHGYAQAAIHIYKKIGFIPEGTLRQHFFAEGEYQDSLMMGIFPHEFTF
ncbi:MAG: GNAT family N-acetyltransferase [Leuconostoc mesenteroides]|uniref:GNAT family N-acetyltransferase n=1 Tax=Leuconostoc mesenteroides TaxID=1245 RepID=UPI0009FD631C|nr:GNAT family N-acetyltransferase [Leuconostoc mesenteroides]MCP9301660.1 GNAT family N-acetyltransferase [Leuconostoc mesenteroides]MCP9326189.1 GNAT family N-acetyltransferase [Leuconostoc mesenteroides]ORI81571.1 spermidine acetyltransferase [Leuconostoc mesenteroides subsp. mesenteroides]